MVGCMALVVGFRSSGALAAAFGLAVAGTMAITTVLFGAVAHRRWGWPWIGAAALAGLFLVIDLAFFGANLLKFADGGWLPLAIGAVVLLLMTTWFRGRALLNRYLIADPVSIPSFLESIRTKAVHRIGGTGVFLSRATTGVPAALLQNVRHNEVLHEQVVLLTITTEEVPFVGGAERLSLTPHPEGVFQLSARYGFMEMPDVPSLLAAARPLGLVTEPEKTTFYLGRESIIASARPGMARWREALFGVMQKNATPASAAFGLPPDRVVELGTQVEI
jgi:KUP system potassium uptake protein